MQLAGQVGRLLRGILSSMTDKCVQLNDTAERLLQEAKSRGYRVSRVKTQGAEAIVLGSGNGAKIYLWSSDDVIEYAKSKKWR